MASFPDRLKELREKAGMTQMELAEKLGVAKGTIGNYEAGGRMPNNEKLEAIADLFNSDIDYLLGRTNDAPDFSLEEKWIIKAYRKADQDTKDGIRMILKRFDQKEVKPVVQAKIIPLFTSSFAAGPSGNFAEDAWEDYEVPADTKADFAIRVSGDSMEPELHDGEIYLCKKRYPEIGEIAVAVVNGEFYVKQFITDGKNIFLRSVNRARKDRDIDIWRSGQYTGRCLGTVIHKRIPLVEQ